MWKLNTCKYFTLKSKLNQENIDHLELDIRTDKPQVSTIQITQNEIASTISTIEPKQKSYPDRISHTMLKISLEKQITNHLKLYLINI